MSPHQVTKDFEAALCEYTGAPYAVAVNSCTMALLLAVAWHLKPTPKGDRIIHWWPNKNMAQIDAWTAECKKRWGEVKSQISIPKRTYVGVPMSIIHAGGRPTFRDEDWTGCYQLKPLPIWDSARWFTSGMYGPGGETAMGIWWQEQHAMACVSFHAAKTLGDSQGGAILHDSPAADEWLRRARFDGRIEGIAPMNDAFSLVGWHCYLSPDVAARLLHKLSVLPKHNDPIPRDDYPDLSQREIFK